MRDYLMQHTDFLQNHPDILDYLHIPHASGSAISLVEKQVDVLRERNIDMRRRLNTLTANARDNDKPYDLKNDPLFSPFGIRVGMAWNTRDYTNTGNGATSDSGNASNTQVDAVLGSTDNGDGTYSVSMPILPDGSTAPGIAASGSK